FFGWGNDNKRVDQMGQNLEALKPPEVEPVEPGEPVAPRAPANNAAGPAAGAAQAALGLPKGTSIGVDITPVDRWNMERLQVKTMDGVIITSVASRSLAEKAGLRTDDIVYQIDKEAVEGVNDFIKIVGRFVEGTTYKFRLYRDGRKSKAYLTYKTPDAMKVAAAIQAEQPWAGVDVQPLNVFLQRQFGLPDTNGAIVSFVEKESPALDAGLQQGDVITAVDGHRVNTPSDLQNYVNTKKVRDKIELAFLRQSQVMTVKIPLIARPLSVVKPQPTFLPGATVEVEASWVGMTLEPLTRKEAKELGLTPGQGGMVVEAVTKDSPADKAGVQVEDVILSVNNVPLKTLTVFKDAADEANGAVLDIIRLNKHLYITIYPPKPVLQSKNGNLKQVALQGEFAYKKIAIGSYGPSLFDQVYPTFELSPFILIYDPTNGDFEAVQNNFGSDPTEACRMLIGRRVSAVIAGNVDQNCKFLMMSENISIYGGVFGHLYHVVRLYKENQLVASRPQRINR
ncbi:MAG: PDZ domain-containing protein, partial [Oligoflexales bacterium]|nr:PDZ domain-containing protein [Oligoflexales bacterium]